MYINSYGLIHIPIDCFYLALSHSLADDFFISYLPFIEDCNEFLNNYAYVNDLFLSKIYCLSFWTMSMEQID